MSLGAFLIYFLKYWRLTVNMVIIFMAYEIFLSDGGFGEVFTKIAAMTGATAALALVMAFIAYIQIKFHVADGNIIYRHHLISSATTTIPLNRIQALRTRQDILYRLFELRGVLFDTLADKEEEIELILSESDWQSLLTLVKRQERGEHISDNEPPAYNPSSYIKFSNKALLSDALCQNHLKGMVVLGGFLAAILNSISDLPENTVNSFFGYIESHFSQFAGSVASIIIIMAITYLVSLVLWLGKVMLRYYDLSLIYDQETLTFSHGMLSHQTSRFARDKICTVSVKRNYLERLSGLGTLALRQALNSSAKKDEDNLKIYGNDSSGFFLSWWLGADYQSERTITTARSGRGVIVRSLLPDVLLSAAATVGLCCFGLYGWIILPAVYLAVAIPKSILMMQHSHITLRESYIVINKGCFADISSYLHYGNVEVVRVTRTPMTRFTGRVSLSVSTSGSTFTIRSLKTEQALHIHNLLLAGSQVITSQTVS